MSLNSIINELRKEIGELQAQTSKLYSRQGSGSGGGGGGSSNAGLMRMVDYFEDLPPAATTPLNRLYKIRYGTYTGGIAYVYNNSSDPASWRLLNYWQ